MENIQQMSMLEVAIKLMNKKKNKQPISKIIKETLEMKGIEDTDGTYAAQLYIDITTSSLFVYMGDEEWDLKIRQSLDEWDKDGSAFNTDVEEDEEEVESADEYYSLDEEDEVQTDSDDYDSDYEEDEDDSDSDELDTEVYDEDEDEEDEDDDNDYMDEDSYNTIMDDYEDMYED